MTSGDWLADGLTESCQHVACTSIKRYLKMLTFRNKLAIQPKNLKWKALPNFHLQEPRQRWRAVTVEHISITWSPSRPHAPSTPTSAARLQISTRENAWGVRRAAAPSWGTTPTNIQTAGYIIWLRQRRQLSVVRTRARGFLIWIYTDRQKKRYKI